VLKGFRDFILRGNVIDLAVAVVIGAAFASIVTALVENIINPLIAAVLGAPNISEVGNFTINGATFSVGAVLQAILNFVFVAAAVYLVLVAPMNKLMTLRKQGEEAAPRAPSEEVLLLTQIRDLLGGADTTVVGPPTGGLPAAGDAGPNDPTMPTAAR
jgi:large conductance mechanosensitive channel